MVWINELHYDNDGVDTGEFVELAGIAGTVLTGYRILLYNGGGGAVYNTVNLSGTIPNEQNGFGTVRIAYPANGIQNGSPDGVALVGPDDAVIAFLSYEGVFTATSGPAAGMTSTDVGVIEPGTQTGTSIGLVGTGDDSADFTWALIADDTPGAVNVGQSFATAAAVTPRVSVADATVIEGDDGTVFLDFIVTRSGGTGAFSVDYATAAGSATAGSDFLAATGTLVFAANETTRTIRVAVTGDTAVESNEALTLTLSRPTGSAVIDDGDATGTITNDDSAAPITAMPWINEFHYDDAGADEGEFIEIAGRAGQSLLGYSVLLYNGTGGAVYNTVNLSGTFPDQENGFGTIRVAYPSNGIQNGAPDGIALVGPGGVIEFLSYEGTFTAVGGAANGLTSTDVGVIESGTVDGTSIARVGAGDSGDDFTWALAGDDTPGQVNTGQTLGVATATRIAIDDVVVSEGDTGTRTATFTVTRSDNSSAFTVDFATVDGTATAGADYVAANGTLDFSAGGALTQTIAVTVNGDVAFEPNETFTVDLANLAVSVGQATLTDAQGIGTIAEDDIALVRIYDIQGAGHRSDFAGQQVTTRGIVTALDKDANGFWIQDATGDGNIATSDAVYVFTGGIAPAAVVIGAEVQVRATVTEFRSASRPDDLTLTELTAPSIAVLSTGNALPTAVKIGAVDNPAASQRTPPTVRLGDDETGGRYDPVNDGIDFYESLEGMRVTFEDVRVTSPERSNFGEIWGTPDVGANPSANVRGGLTIRDTSPDAAPADKQFDLNPERIMIDDEAGIATPTDLTVGDRLGDITGVLHYEFGTYRVEATEAYTLTKGGLEREVSQVEASLDRIRIASFNVENLSPVGTTFSSGEVSTQAKFDALARAIIDNLRTPEIVSLQEVQDNNGIRNDAVVDSSLTLTQLIDAIVAAGGPRYSALVSDPADDQDGGAPGGNIRTAYLYLADVVQPTADNGLSGTAGDAIRTLPTSSRIGADPDGAGPLSADPDFSATRKSFPIEWNAVAIGGAESFWTVNNHFSSKGGSAPLQGSRLDLPLYADPLDAGAVKREGQAIDVNAFIDAVLANGDTSDDSIIALGDFNEFQFFPAVQLVTGALERLTAGSDGVASTFTTGQAVMKALVELLPEADRYSYVFEGNSQTLDQILTTFNLVADAQFDVVHMNAEFSDQLSDHDPSVVSILLARSDLIASERADVLDEAAFVARFGTARGSLAGNDTIDGLGGNDTIRSGAGDDRIIGGAGNDLLEGGSGRDVLLGGSGDDRLFGGDGRDYLSGGDRNDQLDGGAGDDVLVGGGSNDRMTGGAGSDQFLFGPGFNRDTITDFDPLFDRIVLTSAVNAADPRGGMLVGDLFTFVDTLGGGALPSDLTFKNADTNGDRIADSVEISSSLFGKIYLADLTVETLIAENYLTANRMVIGDWLV